MRLNLKASVLSCALLSFLGSATAFPLESSLEKRLTPCSNVGICSGPGSTITCSRNLNPKTPWCICNCVASKNCFPLIADGWCFS
ncbi:hypothetical protein C8J57DRAFT_1381088 [Mycena rebaudengoi]|nr:hypothetical protein C8J57DRAFT_1381088 [Mycena rebaudengoi]